MFRTDLLSIIRSLNAVFTAIGICHTEILKVGKVSSKTVSLSETCRVLYQNIVGKWCILLAFIIRIYHDARPSECQIIREVLSINLLISIEK